MDNREKGNIAEVLYVAKLIELGYNVSIPFGNGHRYDIVVEQNGHFRSIQIKAGKLKNNYIEFNTCSNNKGYKRKSYHGEVDFLGVYCPDNNGYYIIPIEKTGVSQMRLRLNVPRILNNKINYAKDYILQGQILVNQAISKIVSDKI